MNKRMIDGFLSNKGIFLAVGIFAGLFVLVTLAYLFADENLGAQSKEIEGFACTPGGETCGGGIRVFITGTNNVGDGCTKKPNGDCEGTCYWCDPSSDRGRYCKEMIEYNGHCAIDIPNTTMSCGESRPYRCRNNGGHGISGCCPPDENKVTEGRENCDKIATCTSIDE